jgi:hypothetical protein
MSDTNDFTDLKRLLKLKQHEVPPPGYFSHFSGDVVSRIRGGETGGGEGILAQFDSNSVVASFLRLFQAKPGIIGGFATSLCLLLLIGVVMTERPEGQTSAGDISSIQSISSDTTAGLGSVPLMPADSTSGITVGTNSMISLQSSVASFGGQQNPLFQTVGFTTTGQ